MTRITVAGAVGRQLAEIHNCVQLCDEAGQTLGLFTPAPRLILEPSISADELDRREKEEPLIPTAEVLAHLRSL